MRFALTAALLTLVATTSQAAPTLSEDQATDRAVTFLRGDTYGASRMDVITAIKQTKLVTKGTGACGPIAAPVWAFHVHTKYDGWLYIDAATGEKVCSSLPFFR